MSWKGLWIEHGNTFLQASRFDIIPDGIRIYALDGSTVDVSCRDPRKAMALIQGQVAMGAGMMNTSRW